MASLDSSTIPEVIVAPAQLAKRKRKMSAPAHKQISDAQKARWAAVKKK